MPLPLVGLGKFQGTSETVTLTEKRLSPLPYQCKRIESKLHRIRGTNANERKSYGITAKPKNKHDC